MAITGPDDLVIDFHPVQSDSSSSSLIGGTLVETQPLAAATFYNDGTCTPFRAQVRLAAGAHILSVDPWTCAPELSKSDAHAVGDSRSSRSSRPCSSSRSRRWCSGGRT